MATKKTTKSATSWSDVEAKLADFDRADLSNSIPGPARPDAPAGAERQLGRG